MSFTCKFIENEKPISFFWDKFNFIKMHNHEYWECTILFGESIKHITKYKTEILTRGSAILVKESDEHSFSYINSKHPLHLNLMITTNELKKICDSIDPNIFLTLSSQSDCLNIQVSESMLETIEKNINIINHCSKEENFLKKALLKFIMIDLIKEFYESLAFKVDEYPGWLNKFLDDLKKEENICLKTEEIASLASYSYSRLSFLFKKYTKKSLHDYIKDLKLSYAKNMIKSSSESISNIAYKIGYNSCSHFVSTFKNKYGITPYQYRKEKNSSIKIFDKTILIK